MIGRFSTRMRLSLLVRFVIEGVIANRRICFQPTSLILFVMVWN